MKNQTHPSFTLFASCSAKRMDRGLVSVSAVALLSALAAPPVFAQPGRTSAADVSEVIVTGTRQTGIKAADSAAPVALVGAEALIRTGATDLATSLTASVPSINVEMNGQVASALTVQAALRGLSPNQTLVLINGKRRHGTANLHVTGGSAYSGSATTDLSFIPVGAIEHVEVLTDGAAAQYGSDAISGVINLILKSGASGGSITATAGQYYNGQGDNASWSINRGFDIGEDGFLNVTIDQRYHEASVLGTGDRRFQSPDGTVLPNLAFPLSNVIYAEGFPQQNGNNGDPQYNYYDGFFNAGYKLSDKLEIYGFGSYAQGSALHYQNYRAPNLVVGRTSTGQTVYPLPNGFTPAPKFKQQDYSLTGGLKGQTNAWRWDLSATYGANDSDAYTINSGNASLFPILQAQSATPIAAQRNFYDGTFRSSELAYQFDASRDFTVGLASPLNLAFGGEWRRDTYTVSAGEPASYYVTGAQAFIGYTPLDVSDNSRTNYAGYLDLSADVIANLHVDVAARYEKYSDFGDTTSGKFTARYDFSPRLAIRGTVSNGFRAPTLAEEFYSGTNVGTSVAVIQIPANSTAAQFGGFPALKPEKSRNYSVGFVAHPVQGLQITGDFYKIDITDRILVSGLIVGRNGSLVSQRVLDIIARRGVTIDPGVQVAGIQLFTNAADTHTKGAEFTANYTSYLNDFGRIDWSLGLNYNKTKLENGLVLPGNIQNAATGQLNFLNPLATSALTRSQPRSKALLQAAWIYKKFNVNLREVIYGPTSLIVSDDGTGIGAGATLQKIGVTGITDLDIGYQVTEGLRLSLGANNLFNKKPPLPPIAAGATRPIGGGNVWNVPYPFAPWNNNGGYYYARAVYSF